MTEEDLLKLVVDWDSFPDTEGNTTGYYTEIWNRLNWFGEAEWTEYYPSLHPQFSTRYMTRLAKWIGNVANVDEQKTLLEYASQISYFSRSDFSALYQSAFAGPIFRWVLNDSKLKMTDQDFQSSLHDEMLRRTWYCAITDSMDINGFYHVNHVTGIRHRPSFSTLAMLDPLSRRKDDALSLVTKRIRCFMASPARRLKAPNLKRLVILEDFVGSGTQAKPALEWAIRTLECPILFVPLIVCPIGLERLQEIANKTQGRLEIRPLVSLKPNDLLGPRRSGRFHWRGTEALEQLAIALNSKVASPDGPFGFENSGCSFVSFSNTPNNSIPLIHSNPASGQWAPLFPRSARI